MPLTRVPRCGAAVLVLGLLAGCSQDALNTVNSKLYAVDRTIRETLGGQHATEPTATTKPSKAVAAAPSSAPVRTATPRTLAAFFGTRSRPLARLQPSVTTGPQQKEYERGVALAFGNGVPVDESAAARHLKIAADAGHPDAQFLLGLAYWGGKGVAKDRAKAVRLFRKAAEQGHAEAQFLLGLACLRGHGVDKDPRAAVQWFERAANAGHAGAQYQLGVAYLTGQGIARDDKAAVTWLAASAEHGNADAQQLLADAYTNGWGTAPDHAWAALWYGLAAEQGLAQAQYLLGVSYAGGLGVPKDPVESAFWLSRAAASGNADAKKLLPGASAKLTKAQRREVRRRLDRWKPATHFGATSAPIVRYVQVALTRLGYHPGTIDGRWGPNTRAALVAYRHDHGLSLGPRIVANDLFRLRQGLNQA